MHRASIRSALLLAALGAATPVTAAEPTPRQRLEEVERSLQAERETQRRLSEEADALARELANLREHAIALAASLQASEDELAALDRRLAELNSDLQRKEAAFAARRADLVRLVAGLGRVSRQPPEAALVLPGSPIETVRTAKLLGALTPALRAQANTLAAELEALLTAREAVDRQQRTIAAAAERLAVDRESLASLIEQRQRLQGETEAARRSSSARMERLAHEAESLRGLIERLNAEREAAEARQRAEREQRLAALPPPGTAKPFSEGDRRAIPPVRGRIVLSFGEPGVAGQPHRGLTIEARPGAQLVAPQDGTIVFAGPFRTYGLILIIEHSGGYHTLLAGLGRIDGTVGQLVKAGEPVGVAGSPESGNPSIYVELRRNGQPIDPLPWLAPHNEKVSG